MPSIDGSTPFDNTVNIPERKGKVLRKFIEYRLSNGVDFLYEVNKVFKVDPLKLVLYFQQVDMDLLNVILESWKDRERLEKVETEFSEEGVDPGPLMAPNPFLSTSTKEIRVYNSPVMAEAFGSSCNAIRTETWVNGRIFNIEVTFSPSDSFLGDYWIPER